MDTSRPGTGREPGNCRAGTRGWVLVALLAGGLLVVLLAAAAPAAAQWPQEARTPARNATTPDAGPPASLVREGVQEAVLWTATPGQAYDGRGEAEPAAGGPVLHDGTAVVATEGGTVAAYGALDGAPAWPSPYEVDAGGADAAVAGTPAVIETGAGARVVFGAADGAVRALDLDDGTLAWQRDLSPDGDDKIVTAVHARDGRAFVGTAEGEVVALEARDGTVAWRADATDPGGFGPGFASIETPNGTWLNVPSPADGLLRYRPGNGSLGAGNVTGNLSGAPALDHRERLYMGFGGSDDAGEAASYEASDLTRRWRTSVSDDALVGDALHRSGRVFVGDAAGTLHALAAGDGSPAWNRTLVAQARYSLALAGQPAWANGTLYVPSEDGLLFAVDAATGDVAWTVDLRQGCGSGDRPACRVSSPAVWEEKLYVATEGGILWALGPQSAAGPQPPDAQVDVLERGLAVELDASGSSDPNGDDLSYEWRLGDGTGTHGENVVYTYREGGNYSVTLTVRDGTGREDTATAEVRAEPAPSEPWTGPGGDAGADRAAPDPGPPAWTELWRHASGADLASDPLVGSWGVVGAYRDGFVRAFTLGGDARWTHQAGTVAGVARGNGTLFLGDDRWIQALDPADGTPTRNVSLEAPVTSLAVRGSLAAASGEEGRLAVWNASSGSVWRDQFPAPVEAGPVVGPEGEIVVVLSGTERIHAYHAGNGTKRYVERVIGMDPESMSLDGEGLVLSGKDGDGGAVRGWDPASGELRWIHETDEEVVGHAAGEAIYAATAGNSILAVDRSPKAVDEDRRLWRADLDAAPRGTLAASRDVVVVPTAEGVELLDPADGTVRDARDLEAGTRQAGVHGTLAVVQRDGAGDGTRQLVSAGTVPWEAAFTVEPSEATVGETVVFEDASLAPEGAAPSFTFGDAHGDLGSPTAHAYREAGEYTATLSVETPGDEPRLLTRRNVTVHGPGSPPDNGTETGGNDTGEDGAGAPSDGGNGSEAPPDGPGGDANETPYTPDATPGAGAAAALGAGLAAARARRP